MRGLKSRAFTAVRWTSLATVVQVTLQVLQIAIVARILPAEDFGLMAMVWAIMAFAAMLSGMGTANAILHFQTIDHERLSSLYWLNVLFGVLISLALVAASPLIAAWFGETRLILLVSLTGLGFLLAAPGQQLRVQAQKELRFRALARVEISATAVNFCTTVGMAILDFGVYSLVAGILASRALGTILDWAILANGWRPLCRLQIGEIRPFLGIGGYSIIANLANAMHTQADIVLGGRLLSPSAIGEFSLMRNLCLQTYSVVTPIVTRVATPVMSIAQSDSAHLRTVYLNVLRMTSSVNFPLYLALAFFSDEIVRTLYGERWQTSAALLEVLAAWGMLRSIGNPAGSLIQATGRASLAFKWEAAMLVSIPAILWAGLHWGASGLAMAMFAYSAALIFPAWYFLVRPICEIRFSDYAGQLIPPLWIALTAFSIARAAVWAIDSTIPRLALGLTIGFAIYSILGMRFNRPWATAIIALLRKQDTSIARPTTEVDHNDVNLTTSVANVRISVVIPARNREETLAECIESVLAQTLSPTEVIVIDDASTDATVEIATAYAGRGIRVIQLVQPGGAQAARNAGIRAATGDWIAFQDSDDVWVDNKLARQVEALSQRSFDRHTVVYSDYVRRDMTSRSTSRIWLPYQSGECYSSLLIRPGPPFPSLLVSRESLMRIDLLDEKCPAYQEWDTAIRLAKTCILVHLREPLFEWRWHGGETISKDTARRFKGFNYVIHKHRDEVVRLHGEVAWATLDAHNLAAALRDGLYDEILGTFDNETNDAVHRIVRFFARKRICPSGVGRFLQLIAVISTGKHR